MLPVTLCIGIVFIAFLIATSLFPQMRTTWVQSDGEKSNIQDYTDNPPLNSSTPVTAIVGAGIVGLCTAYHLAKANHRRYTAHPHKIIVIEAAEREFAATSGSNTGILTDTSSNKDLLTLTHYSFQQWEDLGKDAEFSKECGYREGVNCSLKRGSGHGQNLMPDWVRAEAEWDVMKDPDNPIAFGHWLYKECSRYGVEFRMSTQAVRANLFSSNQLVSLDLASDSERQTTIRLDNLILAAGPWTPTLFKKLFPDSSIDMEPVIDAGDWIVFKNPKPTSAKSIAAVYLDDIVGEKLEFAGRNDHTIWATGERSRIGAVPKLGQTPEPDQVSLDKLHANAVTFLKHEQGGDHELHVLSQGRSYRPTTRTGMPIIAGVPAGRLSTGGSVRPLNSVRKSVFINSGHGSHGLLLGMGSGKLMSQMLLGEKTDIDVSKMALHW